MLRVSLLSVVLLVLAALAVVGAEWPRLARAAGLEPGARRRRERQQRKSQLRIVRDASEATKAEPDDADEFVASVRRDLDRLPTFDRDQDR